MVRQRKHWKEKAVSFRQTQSRCQVARRATESHNQILKGLQRLSICGSISYEGLTADGVTVELGEGSHSEKEPGLPSHNVPFL